MLSEDNSSVQQLAHFSTKPTTAASRATSGSFTKAGLTEFVLLTHDAIELYRMNYTIDSYGLIHRQSLHSTALCVATVPSNDQAGSPDFLAVTSESGNLTLLYFKSTTEDHGEWHAAANELIGRGGLRSTVPGEYLVVDPQGKCIFVASTFKEKMIFGLKTLPDSGGLALRSPLEARRLSCVFSVVAVDRSSGSPTFAALESPLPGAGIPQSNLGQKYVCFYVYDTNLNQVKTIQRSVPSDATFLAPCHGAQAGVLVCTPYTVMWLSVEDSGKPMVEVPLPMRQDNKMESFGALITGSAYFKSPRGVFFIIQNEHGDLFKVQLDDKLNPPIEYFGRTQPSATLMIVKGGFLMCVAESGDHHLHKITRERFPSNQFTGSVTINRESSSLVVPTYSSFDNSNMVTQHISSNTSPCHAMRMGSTSRGRLRYFSLTHNKQLHCTSYGLSTSDSSELIIDKAAVDSLFVLRDPTPITRENVSINWDSRIVVSHRQGTAVYALRSNADNRLPEVPESVLAFDNNSPTIFAAHLDDGFFLQVTPFGVHAIKGHQRFSWYSGELGENMLIYRAAANRRQIVVSFARGGVATLSFEPRMGTVSVRTINTLLPPVSTLTIAPVRGGSLASVVGIAIEGTKEERKERFAIFHFDTLKQCSKPVDTVSQGDAGVIRYVSSLATYMGDGKLYIYLGTSAGQLIWLSLNAAGDVASIDQFQLGQSPCELVAGDGETYCYAHSDELWRCNFDDNAHQRIPVSLPFAPNTVQKLDFATGRAGLLTVRNGRLAPFIVNVGSGSLYTTQAVQLQGTGRKIEKVFLGNPAKEVFVIACRDGDGLNAVSALQTQDTNLHFTSNPETLPVGDSIVSLTTGVLAGVGTTPVVLVGIAKNLTQSPKLIFGECRIALYTFDGLTLFHQARYSTPVPDLPSAIHITRTGHVVVGMGEEEGLLVLLCGSSRLLQKHRLQDIGSRIVALDSSELNSPYASGGSADPTFLLACGTSDKSVCLVRYHHSKQYQFLIRVATDFVPRSLVTLRFVTASTVVCADRFGNISFLAVPSNALTDIPDRGLYDDTEVQRQSQALRCTGQFHVGQLVNSIDIVTINNRETNTPYPAVVYSTVLGAAGCFVPFQREEDAVLAVFAEPHIKSALPCVLGRSVFAHQSSFYPPCGVIDGDLVQHFVTSSPGDETISAIVDDARASDNRLTRLISTTEVPRFDKVKKDTLITELKQLIARTKPPSIF